jgi:hypothetical protein
VAAQDRHPAFVLDHEVDQGVDWRVPRALATSVNVFSVNDLSASRRNPIRTMRSVGDHEGFVQGFEQPARFTARVPAKALSSAVSA